MIVTEVGEVGVWAGSEHFRFLPSLHAMSRLGTPAEIVRVFSSVMAEFEHPAQLGDSIDVICACCDSDVSPLVGSFHIYGHFADSGFVPGKLTHLRGRMRPYEVIVIAQHLLRHGIIGDVPPLPRKEGEEPSFTTEFDARGHVAAAIAHLGMGREEAWRMTMTELVLALRAKYPQTADNTPGARPPSVAEHEKTMAWYEGVKALRNRSNA